MHETTNPLAVYAELPRGVTFESQEEGEEIILLLRAHLITLVPPILFTIFLIFVPFFVSPLLSLLRIDSLSSLNQLQILLLVIFWYLLVFGYALYKFLFWYFNVYLLTNERIIDFDFRGILNKQIAYTVLRNIEDVTPKTIGFFGTFFNYGDVFIQTAGERQEFEFNKVPRPDDVAEAILKEVRKEESEAPGEVA